MRKPTPRALRAMLALADLADETATMIAEQERHLIRETDTGARCSCGDVFNREEARA